MVGQRSEISSRVGEVLAVRAFPPPARNAPSFGHNRLLPAGNLYSTFGEHRAPPIFWNLIAGLAWKTARAAACNPAHPKQRRCGEKRLNKGGINKAGIVRLTRYRTGGNMRNRAVWLLAAILCLVTSAPAKAQYRMGEMGSGAIRWF